MGSEMCIRDSSRAPLRARRATFGRLVVVITPGLVALTLHNVLLAPNNADAVRRAALALLAHCGIGLGAPRVVVIT